MAVGFSFPTARQRYFAASSLLRGCVLPFRKSSAVANSAAPFAGLSATPVSVAPEEEGTMWPEEAPWVSTACGSAGGGATVGTGLGVVGWSGADSCLEADADSAGFSAGLSSGTLAASGLVTDFKGCAVLCVVLVTVGPEAFCGRDCA